MLTPKFVSSCFHVSQDLHHCQSTPSFLARPKPKISLCSRNQTETRAMQASRFPRWSLTSTSTVNIYRSPLFACVYKFGGLERTCIWKLSGGPHWGSCNYWMRRSNWYEKLCRSERVRGKEVAILVAIYHCIDGTLLASFKFLQRQLVTKNSLGD